MAANHAKKLKSLIPKYYDAQLLIDNIIYNKHDILAINKPNGLPVLGGKKSKTSVMELMEEVTHKMKFREVPQLAHRLDKDCTGVLLLSKSHTAAKRLADLFKEHKLDKTYWALTVGVPKYLEGEITIPLGEGVVDERHRVVLRKDLIEVPQEELSKQSEGKIAPAVTKFRVLDYNKDSCSLVELTPVTGYKHQLRVHLADGLNTPVLGDHKFSKEKGPQILPLRLLQMMGFQGVRSETRDSGKIRPWQRALIPLHLHSRQIVIPELDNGKDVLIKAPIPPYFETHLQLLKLVARKKDKEVVTQSHQESRLFKLRRLAAIQQK